MRAINRKWRIMKKILLFLFGIFLITPKLYASDSTFYKITFRQHATGVTHSGIVGAADIKTGKYELTDLSRNTVIKTFDSNTNYGTNLPDNISFNLKEVSSSLGYYDNVKLNYDFNLNKTCSKITIDIEKKIKEYQLRIENKSNSSNYYYLYDSNNNTIKYNTRLISVDELIVKYDNYRFKTNQGMIDFNIADLNTNKNGIILDNDSLKITITEIELEAPYNPIINITKTCTDNSGNSYEEKIDLKKDLVKENETNDEVNQKTVEVLLPSSSILELNNEIIEPTIPSNEDLIPNDILIETTNEENSKIVKSNIINKNVKSSKKKTEKVNDIKEELESNLIIEYDDKTDYESYPIKYQKASNVPLFIFISLPIIVFLVIKIVKKVRKI